MKFLHSIGKIVIIFLFAFFALNFIARAVYIDSGPCPCGGDDVFHPAMYLHIEKVKFFDVVLLGEPEMNFCPPNAGCTIGRSATLDIFRAIEAVLCLIGLWYLIFRRPKGKVYCLLFAVAFLCVMGPVVPRIVADLAQRDMRFIIEESIVLLLWIIGFVYVIRFKPKEKVHAIFFAVLILASMLSGLPYLIESIVPMEKRDMGDDVPRTLPEDIPDFMRSSSSKPMSSSSSSYSSPAFIKNPKTTVVDKTWQSVQLASYALDIPRTWSFVSDPPPYDDFVTKGNFFVDAKEMMEVRCPEPGRDLCLDCEIAKINRIFMRDGKRFSVSMWTLTHPDKNYFYALSFSHEKESPENYYDACFLTIVDDVSKEAVTHMYESVK